MSKVISTIRNTLGIRKRRRVLPRGPQPAVGCLIIKGDQRMEVLDGLTPDLWNWLLNVGWRKSMYKYDRRRYADIPKEWIVELYRAAPSDRDRVLSSGVQCARGQGGLPAFKTDALGWNAPDLEYLSASDRAA